MVETSIWRLFERFGQIFKLIYSFIYMVVQCTLSSKKARKNDGYLPLFILCILYFVALFQ